jgi:hypothetical protein
MEGFVAFDAMRPQPAVHAVKDPQATVTIPQARDASPAIARLASITNWPLRFGLKAAENFRRAGVNIHGPP